MIFNQMRHGWPALQLLTALLALQHTSGSSVDGQRRVVLDNNGYTGVTIAIDPQIYVPEAERDSFIANVQTMVTDASAALFAATLSRVYFREVTLLVPPDWTVAGAQPDTSGLSYHSALLRVTAGDTVGGTVPYTHRSGPCGTPGLAMTVPQALLGVSTTPYGDVGKVVAQEWLQLRYGVLPEHGVPGDPLYPHAYTDPLANATLPTACAAASLVYTWVDSTGQECQPDPLDSSCRYQLDSGASTSTSSILFSAALPTVMQVCTDETHDPLPPTAHNRLCGGSSVLAVVLNHTDFAGGANQPTSTVDTTPTLSVVVQASTKPLFLLLDDSIRMDPANNGLAIYNTLRRTLSQLLPAVPDLMIGAGKYQTDTFTAYDNGSLTPVSSLDLDAFLSFIPREVGIVFNVDTAGALGATAELLKDSGEVNLLLVEISKDNAHSAAPDLTTYADLTVNAVLYNSALNNEWLPDVVQNPEDRYRFDPLSRPSTASSFLQDLVSDVEVDFLLDEEVSISSGTTTKLVLVDTTTGSFVDFHVSLNTVTDITAQATDVSFEVQLTSPSGVVVNQTNSITFEAAIQVIDAEPGEWLLSVSNTSPVASYTVFMTATSTRRSNTSEPVFASWTNAEFFSASQDVNDVPLVAFFSAFTSDYMPITGLKVTGTVRKASATTSAALEFVDDGIGDPDTTKHDGIYTAYVTDISSGSSELVLDVKVESASESKKIKSVYSYRTAPRLLPSDPFDPEPCCGSSVPDGVGTTLENFSRNITSFESFVVESSGPYDPPPGRVSDFRMTAVAADGPDELAGTVVVTLAWTDTGEDFNVGTASAYDLRYSLQRDQLLTDFAAATAVGDADVVEGDLTPQPAGTPHTVTLQLQKQVEVEAVYYFAVVAVDQAGQSGELSPIEMTAVKAGHDFTTTTTTTSTTTTSTTTTSTTTTSTTSTDTTSTDTTATSTASVSATSTSISSTNSGSMTSGSAQPTSGGGETSPEGHTTPSAEPSTGEPEDPDNFVGSVIFWILIAVVIVVALLLFFFLFRRWQTKEKAKQEQLEQLAIASEQARKFSNISSRARLSFPDILDDTSRRPSLRANVMPSIREVSLSSKSSLSSTSSEGFSELDVNKTPKSSKKAKSSRSSEAKGEPETVAEDTDKANEMLKIPVSDAPRYSIADATRF